MCAIGVFSKNGDAGIGRKIERQQRLPEGGKIRAAG